MNKKSMSGLVMVVLLLALSVATMVSFQIWFKSYNIKLYSNYGKKADLKEDIEIKGMSNKILFIENFKTKDYVFNEIKIGEKNCTIASNTLIPGINKINLTDCLETLPPDIYNLILISDDNVFKKKIYQN